MNLSRSRLRIPLQRQLLRGALISTKSLRRANNGIQHRRIQQYILLSKTRRHMVPAWRAAGFPTNPLPLLWCHHPAGLSCLRAGGLYPGISHGNFRSCRSMNSSYPTSPTHHRMDLCAASHAACSRSHSGVTLTSHRGRVRRACHRWASSRTSRSRSQAARGARRPPQGPCSA